MSTENEGVQDGESEPSGYVLETGGEVHFPDEDKDAHVYDRIIITNGMAVCINKKVYSKDCWPVNRVSIHTHTSDEEENAEWW